MSLHNYKICTEFSKEIFRTYDIRGIVNVNLHDDLLYTLGLVIGSLALEQAQQKIVVARDGRLSSPHLKQAFVNGLLATGCDVIDIGMVPTPLLYFATHYLKTNSGVMITGSHNPIDYNGLKIVIAGKTLVAEQIQDLYQRALAKKFVTGEGTLSTQDIKQAYIDRITQSVKLTKKHKVVIDCGNGIAGVIAGDLFRALNCEVVELYCEVDGNFPNHHPDPSVVENLQDLIHEIAKQKADLGLAFDGDADRLGVVTDQGEIILPDRQLMYFAKHILAQYPNQKIIYDVKCSRHVGHLIRENQGIPIMAKTGHSLLKARMFAEGAIFAGELSGHHFFNDKWYGFDDGIYAGARLIEMLDSDNCSLSQAFKLIPLDVNTPELKIDIAENKKFKFIEEFIAKSNFVNADKITIDGLRVEFANGWGLLRASNTTPCLILRFEADNEQALENIKTLFRQQIRNIDSSLNISF